jgi:hypothetical protein
MKHTLHAVPVFLFAIFCSIAQASSSSSDITDMWWNPAESGWGVNIVLQNDVAFMTFFVYDTTQSPIWYTSDARRQNGTLTWIGNLYATRGPWLGGPFRPSDVTVRPVGTVSFMLSTLNQATLTYVVDGTTVTKLVQRQTWASEIYAGRYAGGYSIRRSACNPSSLNGVDEQVGTLGVTQGPGPNIRFDLANATDSCAFTGTYTQTGKLGQLQGSYNCASGIAGQFNAWEMTPTINGFTARVTGRDQYCQWSGYFGGIRRM